MTMNGHVNPYEVYRAIKPAISSPQPSPPTFAIVLMIPARRLGPPRGALSDSSSAGRGVEVFGEVLKAGFEAL
ncbi:hypothetical protein AB0C84_11905 [Actinomadura sp. NPDC048955]|uniref:hypothetical protein n=1 Tax=Actinomadura sp. NPDC048955 TaxID=3158228 RepID=UPI0033D80744